MSRGPARPVELHLLRFLPGQSPLHRMWPGTKLLLAVALGLAVGFFPTWPAAAALAVLLAMAVGVARIPVGVLPRLPRWFLIGVAVSAALSVLSTKAPKASVFGINVSLGGLEEWARFSVLGVLVFVSAALVGWTTPMADLPPAIRSLLRPLRLIRLPVDELAVAVALGVRCVPLLFEELATLAAARRARRIAPAARRPPVRTGARRPAFSMTRTRQAAEDAVDLLVTAMASSLRRAGELAEAMDARGGVTPPAAVAVRLGWPDVMAAAITATAIAVMALA